MAAALLGLALFGGLILLAVAGVSAATAVLITGAAVVVMIGLGNAVGGRHTPNQPPYRSETDENDTDETETDETETDETVETRSDQTLADAHPDETVTDDPAARAEDADR